jgi:hypothetical protein
MPADESHTPEPLLAREPPAVALFPLAWSRRGGQFAFSRVTAETNRDIFTWRVGETPQPFAATPRDERAAMFSPDGRWIVYAVTEVGREEQIYVQSYPLGRGREVVATGIEPIWSRVGNEIFYRSADGRSVMAVLVETEPTLSVGTPRTLFQGRFPVGVSFWSDYDVTPDGNRFLMLEAAEESYQQLNVVVNWFSEVQQRVPVK